MRRSASRFSGNDDKEDINLTPMLDVVFIMLIFFIVTATFIKQAGIDVTKPIAVMGQKKPTVSVLVAISEKGEIWIDKKRVDESAVRANIERIHAENPKGSMVIQADRAARAEKLLIVLSAARAAGLTDVSVATEF